MRGGPADVLRAAARLSREGRPFVLATVVRAERPTSARPGAKALVTPDGEILGFVGGACVRPAVRREALRALELGTPRLLRIGAADPDSGPEEGVVRAEMACVSGGTLEVHIDPFLPARRMVLVGASPVVAALARLAPVMGCEVDFPDDGEEIRRLPEGALVVVAGHGEGEWDALRTALGSGRAAYVGLVASPKRAAAVRRRLVALGLSRGEADRLRSPAGLDLGAANAGEIAVSILAEIIRELRRPAGKAEMPAGAEGAPLAAIALEGAAEDLPVDPICGMSVRRDSPHRVERDGTTTWFCCAGCRDRFLAASPPGG